MKSKQENNIIMENEEGNPKSQITTHYSNKSNGSVLKPGHIRHKIKIKIWRK